MTKQSVSGGTGGVSAITAGRLMRWATYASLTTAVILIVVKIGAVWLTNSVAMLTSLVDSGLDAMASGLTLVAVRHALTPADAEHRFGHGKAESLAGLGQAAFIAGSAVFLLFEAASRLVHPHPIDNETTGIAVMVISTCLTLALVLFQRYVVARSKSLAIGADAMHYKSDLLTNVSIIAGLFLTWRFDLHWIDPVLAIGIALYILLGAIKIFRDAFDHLMDHELPDNVRDEIREVVLRHPQARALHDLRTRSAGTAAFVQLHLELDPGMTLAEAHRISDEIEADIMALLPNAEVLIHQDPAGYEPAPAAFAN